ncbi:putative transport protein [Vibrio ponticus]|nr:putative transport protein [Vibrio ponticus]
MSTAAVHISSSQDVVDAINDKGARKSNLFVIFVALGGILIDAYQATMVGFGNSYIAQQFGISPGFAALVNASVLVSALIAGLYAQTIANRFGQQKTFLIGMGLCTIGAVAVAFAPNIWVVLVCRILMGVGLGIDFPLATTAVSELNGAKNKKTGGSVNLWQMGWYVSTTVVYLVLISLNAAAIDEPMLWRYGIFIGAIFAVLVMILRYTIIGESATWAARTGRFELAGKLLRDQYNINAVIDPNATAHASKTKSVKGAYSILLSPKYRGRTILGCVVATMQAWQYNAVGVYLPLTLAGILSGGLSHALGGSALVNVLCGVTGGGLGSLFVARFGARFQAGWGFTLVTLALLCLGLLSDASPWVSLFLLGLIIFCHSAGPGGLGMTIATMSFPPSIRTAAIGFARAIMRAGAIAGLVLWPMAWGAWQTDAFFVLAAVPFIGAITCLLIRWDYEKGNVDAEDKEVLDLLNKN